MESIQLSITGMKCGGCVSTVEKILNHYYRDAKLKKIEILSQ